MEMEGLEKVRASARRIVEFAGMELVHLEMKREPVGWVLRLYIDKEGGITLDDCSRISRQVSTQLDVDDPFPHKYSLEVSSPGLDRPLIDDRDFEKFAGRVIRLSTREPVNGRRNYKGRLLGLYEGAVHLVLEGDVEVAIPRDQVAKARLEVEMDEIRAPSGARGRHA